MRHVPKLVTVILLLAMRTPARAHSGAPPIEVMTYNLYLGADIEDLQALWTNPECCDVVPVGRPTRGIQSL